MTRLRATGPKYCSSIPDSRHTYFISKATRLALGPTQPRIQYVAWRNRPKRKTNLSPPYTAKGGTILYGLHTYGFTLQQQQRIKPFQACSVVTGVRLWISSHVDTHFFKHYLGWQYRSFLINAVSNSTIISFKLCKYIWSSLLSSWFYGYITHIRQLTLKMHLRYLNYYQCLNYKFYYCYKNAPHLGQGELQ